MGVLDDFHVVYFRSEVLLEGGMLCELFFWDYFDGEREVIVLYAVGQEDSAETAAADLFYKL